MHQRLRGRAPALPALAVVAALALPSALGLGVPALDAPVGVWLQSQRVLPDDASDPGCWGIPNHAYGKFGWALAADGDLLAVGMLGCNPGLPGAVYVYERSDTGWVQQAKVQHDEHDRGFGVEVALDGDVLVVGAPYAQQLGPIDHGAAYVYERAGDAWQLRATLFPRAPQEWGYFGMKVAVSGDVIAVSAHGEDGPGGRRAGAVYLYERDAGGWTLAQHIAGAEERGILGWALDLDGGTLLAVSRVGTDGSLLAFGKVGSSWVLDQVLAEPDFPMVIDISIDGDAAIAGAPATAEIAGVEVPFVQVGPVHTGKIGTALVLEHGTDGWEVVARLENPRHLPMESFGSAVALDGDLAVVGALGANPGWMGAAYVYERSGGAWGLPAPVFGDDTNPADGVATTGDMFGWAVALSGREVLASAPLDHNGGDLPSPLGDAPLHLACAVQAATGYCPGGQRAGTVYAFREALT